MKTTTATRPSIRAGHVMMRRMNPMPSIKFRRNKLWMALMVLLISLPAMAQTLTSSGSMPANVDYIIEGGAVKISASPDAKGDIVIPSSITLRGTRPMTLPVTGILSAAFNGCTELTSIELPAGIKSIGDSAFFGCTTLTTVNIPDSTTSISNYTFAGCSALTKMVIPDQIATIGDGAFDRCSNLTKLTLGSGLLKIGLNAFYTCYDIDTVVAKSEVPPAADDLLYDFQGTTLVVPSVVAKARYATDEAWKWFGNITVADGYGNWPEGVNFTVDDDQMTLTITSSPVAAGEIVIPETLQDSYGDTYTVTAMADSAFFKNTKITAIQLPNTIISLRTSVFNTCYNLKKAVLPENESITLIPPYFFNECNNLVDVNLPQSVKTIDMCAFKACTKLESVILPESLKTIGWCAFLSALNLTSITFPDAVETIRDYAFMDARKLSEITIGKSLKSIRSKAFKDCPITKITVHAEVPPVIEAEDAFSNYDATLYVPDETAKAAYAAADIWKNFAHIEVAGPSTDPDDPSAPDSEWPEKVNYTLDESALTLTITASPEAGGDIVIPDTLRTGGKTYTVKAVTDTAFQGNKLITSIQLPNTIETIGKYAFRECSKLTTAVLPENITEIPIGLFLYCGGLTSVDLPQSIERIGMWAFFACYKLKSVVIPPLVKELKMNSFGQLYAIDSIHIPDAVESIDKLTFEYSKFKKITIGTGLKSIGSKAFFECTDITQITIKATVPPTAPDDAFNNYDATLYVPDETAKAAYVAAPCWKNFAHIEVAGTSTVPDDPTDTVATPTFSVPSCEVNKGTIVTIACETTGATIYYTTDGSAPTSRSTEYTTAVVINEALTLKAIAFKGEDSSRVATAAYTIKEEVTKYTVRLKVNNAEWGKVEGAGEFEAGSEVTIKAIANEGYNFVVWKDSSNTNVSSTANYTFKLEKDVTLTAIFTEETANDATELSGVSIYPNPSNGEFTLDLPAAASIEVFAANGILHRRMEACAGNSTLNIERSGIYFLRITAKERTTIKRVVVR